MHLYDCQNVLGKGQGGSQPINNKKNDHRKKNVVGKGQPVYIFLRACKVLNNLETGYRLGLCHGACVGLRLVLVL